MAWSVADLSSTIRALAAADKPMILARNWLRESSVASRWNTTGSFSTADASATGYGGTYAYDGFSHVPTKPNASQTTWYYLMDLGTNRAFDAVAVLQHNLATATSLTVTLQIADNSTFGTNLTDIYSWSPSTSTKRLIGIVLKNTGSIARSFTAQYVRLKFVAGAGFIPNLGEVIVAPRRQLKHQPNYPWNPKGWKSTVDEFTSSSQIRTRYTQASGQRRIQAQLTTGEGTYWNDLDTFFQTDTSMGTRPFIWIDQPTTDPQNAPWFLINDPDYSNPYMGPNERQMDLVAYEQGGQFVSVEV